MAGVPLEPVGAQGAGPRGAPTLGDTPTDPPLHPSPARRGRKPETLLPGESAGRRLEGSLPREKGGPRSRGGGSGRQESFAPAAPTVRLPTCDTAAGWLAGCTVRAMTLLVVGFLVFRAANRLPFLAES